MQILWLLTCISSVTSPGVLDNDALAVAFSRIASTLSIGIDATVSSIIFLI
jgi:hypothetical protein